MKLIVIISVFLVTSSCMFNSTSNKNGRRSPASSTNLIEGIVNPESQKLSNKVSIYKNYSGGLKFKIQNLKTFIDRNLKVDIKFGHLDETLTTLSGTIQKEGEDYYLLVNLFERNFNEINLNYHLFDYSSYGSLKISSPDIIQSNLHENLYCRGLKASDDPTLSVSSCTKAGEKCLYTYAQIKDQGLLNLNTGEFKTPSVMQFTRDDDGFQDESSKCLDDDKETYISGERIALNSDVTIDGVNYSFRGPYKPIDQDSWEVKGDALWGDYGIFGFLDLNGGKDPSKGYFSRLFPIASKIKLSNFLLYIGSDNPRSEGIGRGTRSLLDEQGFTRSWMTGCNRRVQTTNSVTKENISSCNVSALIEVYFLERGEKVVIASTDDESSKNVRLQLVLDSSLNGTSGGKTCISDSGCASNECCVGNQCVSDTTRACDSTGGLISTGQACDADYKCRSGCCKGNICVAHDGQNNFCDKGVGESCLNSIFCAMDNELFATRIVETSPGTCVKQVCNLDRLNCSVDTFTCRRNSIQGDQGSEDNPIDNYPGWEDGDCNGSIPASEVEANRWICN